MVENGALEAQKHWIDQKPGSIRVKDIAFVRVIVCVLAHLGSIQKVLSSHYYYINMIRNWSEISASKTNRENEKETFVLEAAYFLLPIIIMKSGDKTLYINLFETSKSIKNIQLYFLETASKVNKCYAN